VPLVRIDLLRGRPDGELAAIASCVHEAMVAELGVPERDRFQILTQHEPGKLTFDRGYLGVDRGDGWLLVQVTLAAGRSTEAKQAFYARLRRRLGRRLPGRSPGHLGRALPQLVAAAGQVRGLRGVARQLDGFVVGRA
jgi:Tautomerase enzyme